MTTRLTPFLAAILILGCGSENENRPEGDSAVSLPNQDQGPLSHDGGINPDARAAEDAAPPAADTGQMDVGSVVDAMPSLDLGAGTDAMLPPAPPTAEHAFILPVPTGTTSHIWQPSPQVPT